MKPEPRKVLITYNETKNMWFVCFQERRKYCRRYAAQFDARLYTKEIVLDWISVQPTLKLINQD